MFPRNCEFAIQFFPKLLLRLCLGVGYKLEKLSLQAVFSLYLAEWVFSIQAHTVYTDLTMDH